MMVWEMVLEAVSQWSSTAAGRNDGGDLFPLDGSESPLSLFDFTPRPTAWTQKFLVCAQKYQA